MANIFEHFPDPQTASSRPSELLKLGLDALKLSNNLVRRRKFGLGRATLIAADQTSKFTEAFWTRTVDYKAVKISVVDKHAVGAGLLVAVLADTEHKQQQAVQAFAVSGFHGLKRIVNEEFPSDVAPGLVESLKASTVQPIIEHAGVDSQIRDYVRAVNSATLLR